MDLPPGFHPSRLPSRYADHPSVAGHYFFTIPKELLEDVVDLVGETQFDRELLAVERALSAECGDHSSTVGFRDGVPVHYGLLGRPLNLGAIATGHPGRGKALPRLARIFVLQHYWRALFSRHATALAGQFERLREVFAAFLMPEVNPEGDSILAAAETIRKDLQDLSRAHGGPAWATRASPLEGP